MNKSTAEKTVPLSLFANGGRVKNQLAHQYLIGKGPERDDTGNDNNDKGHTYMLHNNWLVGTDCTHL
jgi:hypothetical protein